MMPYHIFRSQLCVSFCSARCIARVSILHTAAHVHTVRRLQCMRLPDIAIKIPDSRLMIIVPNTHFALCSKAWVEVTSKRGWNSSDATSCNFIKFLCRMTPHIVSTVMDRLVMKEERFASSVRFTCNMCMVNKKN